MESQEFQEYWPEPSSRTHKDYDYHYRPDIMENFSLYFFAAGTKTVDRLHSHTWLWHTASDREITLHRLVKDSAGRAHTRFDHPCYRNGDDTRLCWRSKTIKTATGASCVLHDEEGNIASSADHYVEIRTQEPWRVPLIYGRFPKRPQPDSEPSARGEYALFAMLLFRPWRSPS